MKKENPHWFLSFEDFLSIQNEFADNEILFPFEGVRIEMEDKTKIDTSNIEGKLQSIKNTLELLLKDKPKQFIKYVSNEKSEDSMSSGELFDAGVRYKHFHDLWMLFRHFTHWLELEQAREDFNIDGKTYNLASTDVFTVRKTRNTRGKIEAIVSKESFKNDIFDGLNLNRLKRCERCRNYFLRFKR